MIASSKYKIALRQKQLNFSTESLCAFPLKATLLPDRFNITCVNPSIWACNVVNYGMQRQNGENVNSPLEVCCAERKEEEKKKSRAHDKNMLRSIRSSMGHGREKNVACGRRQKERASMLAVKLASYTAFHFLLSLPIMNPFGCR